MSEISNCRLIFKGLDYVFSWTTYLPISNYAVNQISLSRSVIRPYISVFNILRIFNKSVATWDRLKQLAYSSRSDRGSDWKDLGHVLLKIFFSAIEVLNKIIKVICSLDKKKIIDLSLLLGIIPQDLKKASIFISLITSSRRLAFAAIHFNACSTDQIEKPKQIVMLEVASCALKFFYYTVLGASIYFSGSVSPLVTLALSTVAYTCNLAKMIIRTERSFISVRIKEAPLLI